MITANDLAYRLGLKHYHNSWRGDCPSCGYKGAFAVSNGKRGTLLWCANGCDQTQLAEAVNAISGGAWSPPEPSSPAKQAEDRERKKARALVLWNGSDPAAGSIIEKYLAGRGLPGLANSPVLRFRGDTPHPEGARLPAMVALITDHNDQPLGIHRTFVASDGSGKANVEPPKASLGPIWTGAIRLDPPGPELVVAEGVESAASAGRLLNLPAWSAVSAGNLAAGLVLPPGVKKVVIAADHDPPTLDGKHPGQDAARSAWFRWRGEGREVRIFVPNKEGHDFNNILQTRLAKEAVNA